MWKAYTEESLEERTWRSRGAAPMDFEEKMNVAATGTHRGRPWERWLTS